MASARLAEQRRVSRNLAVADRVPDGVVPSRSATRLDADETAALAGVAGGEEAVGANWKVAQAGRAQCMPVGVDQAIAQQGTPHVPSLAGKACPLSRVRRQVMWWPGVLAQPVSWAALA